MHNKLTIAIPAYNRPHFLKENIQGISKLCEKYDVKIYISDDSTNDEIKDLFDSYFSKFNFITYKKNPKRLGHDRNIISCLKSIRSEYVWLVGDSLIIEPDIITKIINTINENNFDIISVLSEGRKITEKSKPIVDPEEVFMKFCWHMTLTGSTIYSKKSISLFDFDEALKFKNFPHIVFIFRFLKNSCNFYWLNEVGVRTIRYSGRQSYWAKNTIEVFVTDWTNALMSLSDLYTYDDCKKVSLMHSSNQNTFGFIEMLNLRRLGGFNYRVFKENKKQLLMHSNIGNAGLIIISIIPPLIINILRTSYRMIKSNKLKK